MMLRGVLKNTFLVVFVLLAQFALGAELGEKSSIVGTFTGGKTIQNAGVTVRLLDSVLLKEVARTLTGQDGTFLMPNLLPGIYLITVDAGSMKGMFKRVQVVSGAPTFIDIRPLLSEEERKEHSGWERFKWTIRMAERNPLRNGTEIISANETLPPPDGLMAALRNFQTSNNIQGEVSYLSLGGGFSEDTMSHQMAQFALQGRLENTGSWSFNGNYLDGLHSSYLARGGVDYELFDHSLGFEFSANDLVFAEYPELISRQRIARFVESPNESIEGSRWIASAAIQDRWPIHDNLQVQYGVRIDHFGYLLDAVHYSPRLGLSINVSPEVAFHSAFFRNASAPGNFYPELHGSRSYIHEIAFVPYGSSLVPEIAEGFESGIDYTHNDFRFALIYSYQNIQDKIATVDVRNTPVSIQLQSLRPFVIFNASDLQAHGVEAQFEKRISDLLTAKASYHVTRTIPLYILEKGTFSQRKMYFKQGESSEDFHDVQAGIQADIQQTLTQVSANWKWSSGSPLVFGRKTSGPLAALDLEFYQGLPLQVFSESDLKLLVAIQNVLDREEASSTNADYYRALQYDQPRIISGGVLVQF